MTKKQITIVLEGNARKKENAYHELSKFVSEANAEPELTASIQSNELEDAPTAEFSKASE